MTVSSTSSRIVHVGNGSATEFPFAFKVQQPADLAVVYTDATGTDVALSAGQYGATGFGADSGGVVTYPLSGPPIASGTRLTVYRNVAATQPAQISNQGALWPAVIEAALDRLTFICQRFVDGLSRSLVVSESDGQALAPLPAAALRASKVLGFDAAGQPVPVSAVGSALVSAWLADNFLPAASRTAALGALGGAGVGDDNVFTGANDFTGGSLAVDTGLPGAGGTNAASQAYVDNSLVSLLSGRRNRLINGDFAIDQRNAGAAQTLTAGAAVAYTIDRWYASCTGASISGQRVAGTAASSYAWRFTGAAANSGLLFGQRIEAANVADLVNADVVVSLQVKSSSLTSLVWKAYHANAADNFSAKTQIATGTIGGVSPTLAPRSFSFNLGANAGNGIAIEFEGAALLASQTLQVEALQLEKGTEATPFERLPYGQRLADCLRYLPSFIAARDGTNAPLGTGTTVNSSTVWCHVPFRVPARVAPGGISYSDMGHFSLARGDGVLFACNGNFALTQYTGTQGVMLQLYNSANGLTTGQATFACLNNASGYLLFAGCEL